ncbi:MazG-like family protein [Limosilactobacillus sp. Sa3CUN2]|uniref:MazG-like family protein n=1 Tax=Limosilactobacillus avistercoris TaxID=2762243 RepID=A0ABR8PD81_9LACO|nr:MazG-like family protein [Limosilactobacillus avistercoris]MBD7895250.1 MazG-like family protein [Limosilactobacillus avistercoris]
MTYEELIPKIMEWAHQRKIDQADPRVEFMKLAEEVGELSGAYNKKNHERLVDSIGDLQIALLIFCRLVGVDHKEALTAAYQEIAHRQGETTPDGVFIKQSDIEKEN